MSEVQCVKVRLRDGLLPRVREWVAEIDRRREEVLATLRDEDVTLELYFLDQTATGDYLVGVIRADDIGKANEIFARSSHPIDAYYKQFMSGTFESFQSLELLVELDRLEGG